MQNIVHTCTYRTLQSHTGTHTYIIPYTDHQDYSIFEGRLIFILTEKVYTTYVDSYTSSYISRNPILGLDRVRTPISAQHTPKLGRH